MKPKTLALVAGTPMDVHIGGEYFFIDSCPDGGLTVEFFGRDGAKRDESIESGVAGTEATPEGGFAKLTLTSATTQNVRFYVASGRIRVNRFSGDVTILGTVNVSDRAARLVGIVYGALGQLAQKLLGGVNALVTTERGYEAGASYSLGALGAGVPVAVFEPAANVNGAIVWDATGISGAAAAWAISLLAKNAPPASQVDGIILTCAGSGSAATQQIPRMPRPRYLAPGLGLYWFSTAAETVATHGVDYTLL